MTDLNIISTQLDEMIVTLRNCCASGEKSFGQSSDEEKTQSQGPDSPLAQQAKEMAAAQEKEKARRESEKPRQILKDAAPVDVLSINDKTLDKLAGALSGKDEQMDDSKPKEASWLESIINTIGMPIMAMAGGVLALLSAANIDFGAFEGITNLIGKHGFVKGFAMFMKPFAKLFTKQFLRRIPVLGGLVSFYFAYERFKNDEPYRGAIDLVSGILNLTSPLTGGIGYILSIGLDILNAYLDYQYGPGQDGADGIKKDIIVPIKEWGKKIYEKISPYIVHIPIIGALVRAERMYRAYQDSDWGNVLLEGGLILTNFMPMLYPIASIGVSLLQGLFNPNNAMAEDVAFAKGVGSIWDMTTDALFGPFAEWYQGLNEPMQWFIDSMLPESMEQKLKNYKKPKQLSSNVSVRNYKGPRDLSNKDLVTGLADGDIAGDDAKEANAEIASRMKIMEQNMARSGEAHEDYALLRSWKEEEDKARTMQRDEGLDAYKKAIQDTERRDKIRHDETEQTKQEQIALMKKQIELLEQQNEKIEESNKSLANNTIVNNSTSIQNSTTPKTSIHEARQRRSIRNFVSGSSSEDF